MAARGPGRVAPGPRRGGGDRAEGQEGDGAGGGEERPVGRQVQRERRPRRIRSAGPAQDRDGAQAERRRPAHPAAGRRRPVERRQRRPPAADDALKGRASNGRVARVVLPLSALQGGEGRGEVGSFWGSALLPATPHLLWASTAWINHGDAENTEFGTRQQMSPDPFSLVTPDERSEIRGPSRPWQQ